LLRWHQNAEICCSQLDHDQWSQTAPPFGEEY
jgi:hypothetical protein